MPVPGLPAQHQPLTQPGQQEIRVTASWPEQLSLHRIQAVSEPNPKQEESASHTCQLGPQPWRTPEDSSLPTVGTLPQRRWPGARGLGKMVRGPGRRRSPAPSSRQGGGNLSGLTAAQVEMAHRTKNPQISPTRNSQCSRFCQDVTE